MSAPRFTDVDDYLASLDATKGKTLREVIDYILTQFPDLEAKIAWNVPQIHRGGKYIFGVCALKNHLALAPWSPRVLEDFKPRFGTLVVKANLFQVPVDWKIDKKLLKDLVKARLSELG